MTLLYDEVTILQKYSSTSISVGKIDTSDKRLKNDHHEALFV